MSVQYFPGKVDSRRSKPQSMSQEKKGVLNQADLHQIRPTKIKMKTTTVTPANELANLAVVKIQNTPGVQQYRMMRHPKKSIVSGETP
jgi:hypothetical protein